jgi:hypothetical protein
VAEVRAITAQAKADAGAVAAGARNGDRLFQQGRRACRVTGVEVKLGCLDATSEEPGAVAGRCQLPRQLQQLGGCVRSSPPARVGLPLASGVAAA